MDLERAMNRQESKNSFSKKMGKDLDSSSPQTDTSVTRTTDKLQKQARPMYLGLAFSVENAALRYCSRDRSDLIQFALEPRRNWKWKSEGVEEMRTRREDGSIFALSNLFSECEMYVQCILSVGRADQFVRKIVEYEVCGQ